MHNKILSFQFLPCSNSLLIFLFNVMKILLTEKIISTNTIYTNNRYDCLMDKISIINHSCCCSFPANLPDTLSMFGNIINLKFSGSPEFPLSYNSHHLLVNILPQTVFQKYFRTSLLKVNLFHSFSFFNNIHLKV